MVIFISLFIRWLTLKQEYIMLDWYNVHSTKMNYKYYIYYFSIIIGVLKINIYLVCKSITQ